MHVFISQSGPLSKAFAELLATWLPDVIQRVKPWVSSQDIDKGSLRPNEINEALSTTVGISCVTQENKDAPWLLFEAGALQKGLTKARVCPLERAESKEQVFPTRRRYPSRLRVWRMLSGNTSVVVVVYRLRPKCMSTVLSKT